MAFPPSWIEDFVHQLSLCLFPQGAPSPLGCHYHFDTGCWEIAIFPSMRKKPSENQFSRQNQKSETFHPSPFSFDIQQALPLFEEFLAAKRKQAKENDPRFANLLTQISLDLLKYNQDGPAEKYLRECLTIREKAIPNHWLTSDTKSLLGEALAGQKKFEEAEPLLIAGYEGLKKHEKEIPEGEKKRIPEAARRLVNLYTAWEKPEEAAKWQKILQTTSKQAIPNKKKKWEFCPRLKRHLLFNSGNVLLNTFTEFAD